MNKRVEAFKEIIPASYGPVVTTAIEKAPVNIALIKYWGKRDSDLNLPVTDSLSISIQRYTTTAISKSKKNSDTVFLNGKEVSTSSSFYQKLVEFLNHVRPSVDFYFEINTSNDIPTGAGLASSASGFSALSLALNSFFGWDLSLSALSKLARLGSGSACRSIYPGLVYWKKGDMALGEDSYAIPLPKKFPELVLGVFFISEKEKEISSRLAMEATVKTSPLYKSWPNTVDLHMSELQALLDKLEHESEFAEAFPAFGKICEQNALSMHATMIASSPPILYWTPKTAELMKAIFQYRQEIEVPIYITMDAGPNIKVLFLERDRKRIQDQFSELVVVEPHW